MIDRILLGLLALDVAAGFHNDISINAASLVAFVISLMVLVLTLRDYVSKR